MARPTTTATPLDGGLGVLAPDPAGASAIVGVAPSGTVGTIYTETKPQQVKTDFTAGEVAQATCHEIVQSGGKTVFVSLATQTVTGTAGTVTKVGTSPLVTTTGSLPVDAYQVRLRIILGGAVGTATFQYSLDGGDNYSGTITTVADYLIPGTGVHVLFTAGTYVAGDTEAFDCTAPGYSLADAMTATDVLHADKTKAWAFVHYVGRAASAAAAATFAASLESKLNGYASADFRYVWGLIEAPEDTAANLVTAFAASSCLRVGCAAGYVELASDFDGRVYKRPAAWPIAARLKLNPISVDAMRDPGDSTVLALTGISSSYLVDADVTTLDAARFMVVGQIIGRQGFYCQNANLLAPTGSDFSLVQYRQIMDVACSTERNALVKYQSARVPIVPTTGFIDPAFADAVDNDCTEQLRSALERPKHASSAKSVLARTENVLSTRTLNAEVSVVPPGYAKTINATIRFRNPALQQAA